MCACQSSEESEVASCTMTSLSNPCRSSGWLLVRLKKLQRSRQWDTKRNSFTSLGNGQFQKSCREKWQFSLFLSLALPLNSCLDDDTDLHKMIALLVFWISWDCTHSHSAVIELPVTTRFWERQFGSTALFCPQRNPACFHCLHVTKRGQVIAREMWLCDFSDMHISAWRSWSKIIKWSGRHLPSNTCLLETGVSSKMWDSASQYWRDTRTKCRSIGRTWKPRKPAKSSPEFRKP